MDNFISQKSLFSGLEFLVGIIFLFYICLFITPGLFAEGESEPNVAQFNFLRGDGDPNYNGDLNFSLPLLTVPGRAGLGYDINLNYVHGGGVPAKQNGSWVGLGWNLNVGQITCSPCPYYKPLGEDGLLSLYSEDMFFLSLPDGTGGEIALFDSTWFPVKWQNLKIETIDKFESDTLTTEYKQFVVSTLEGTRYVFDEVLRRQAPEVSQGGKLREKRYATPESEKYWYTYAYKLRAILAPDFVDVDEDGKISLGDKGGWIQFVYSGIETKVDMGAGAYFEVNYLKQIITPTHRALFKINSSDPCEYFYFDAYLNSSLKKLSSIQLFKFDSDTVDANIIKEIKFDYSDSFMWYTTLTVFGTKKRLRLNSVTEYGHGGASSGKSFPSTKFYYNQDPDLNIPPGGNDYVGYADPWGYITEGDQGSGNNHEPDTSNVVSWMLQSVVYPTGDSICFEYESDRFIAYDGYPFSWHGSPGDSVFGGGVRLKQKVLHDKLTGDSAEYKYEYAENYDGFGFVSGVIGANDDEYEDYGNSLTFFNTVGMNYLTDVHYPDVTIIFPKGGKVKKYYTTAASGVSSADTTDKCPPTVEVADHALTYGDTVLMQQRKNAVGFTFVPSDSVKNLFNNYQERYDDWTNYFNIADSWFYITQMNNSWKRGFVWKEEYFDSSGAFIRRIENYYKMSPLWAKEFVINNDDIYSDPVTRFCYTPTGWAKLWKTIVKDSLNWPGSTIKEEEYTYHDTYGLLEEKKEKINYSPDERNTINEYVEYDLNNPVGDSLEVNPPIFWSVVSGDPDISTNNYVGYNNVTFYSDSILFGYMISDVEYCAGDTGRADLLGSFISEKFPVTSSEKYTLTFDCFFITEATIVQDPQDSGYAKAYANSEIKIYTYDSYDNKDSLDTGSSLIETLFSQAAGYGDWDEDITDKSVSYEITVPNDIDSLELKASYTMNQKIILDENNSGNGVSTSICTIKLKSFRLIHKYLPGGPMTISGGNRVVLLKSVSVKEDQDKLVSYTENNYSDVETGSASRYYKEKEKIWLDADDDNIVDTGELITAEEYISYDDFGNPEEVQDANGTVVTTKWGYDFSLPLATFINAEDNETIIDDFGEYSSTSHALFTDRWSEFYGGNITTYTEITDNYELKFENTTANDWKGLKRTFSSSMSSLIFESDITPSNTSNTFFVSVRNGSGYIALMKFENEGIYAYDDGSYSSALMSFESCRLYHIKLEVYTGIDEWYLFVDGQRYGPFGCTYASAATYLTYFDYKSSGYALIDNVRVYPTNAQCTSQFYDSENFMVSGTSDENGVLFGYEYDELNRLSHKKIGKNQILSTSDYYYSRDYNNDTLCITNPNYVKTLTFPNGWIQDSLIGFWKFDSTTLDYSGNNNSCTRINGADFSHGYIDKGMKFDGTNDRVDVDSLNGFSGISDLTVSAWIKQTGSLSNADGVIASHYYWDSGQRSWIFLVKSSGEVQLIIWNEASTSAVVTSTDSIDISQWYHVTGTYDGSALKIYINGEEKGSTSASLTLAESTYPVQIGDDNNYSAGTNQFKGIIDDLKIYKRALNDTEILSEYHTIISKTFTDGQGREVQNSLRNGYKTIIAKKSYNNVGKIEKEYIPVESDTVVNQFQPIDTQTDTLYTTYKYYTHPLLWSKQIFHPGGNDSIRFEYGAQSFHSNMYRFEKKIDETGSVTKSFFDRFDNNVGGYFAEDSGDEIDYFKKFNILGNMIDVQPPNYFNPPSGSESDWDMANEYNTLGQLIKKTTPDDSVTQYIYDDLGNLRFSQSAEQSKYNDFTVYYYDVHNRITIIGEEKDYASSWSTSKPSVSDTTYGKDNDEWKIKHFYDVSYIAGIENYCRGRLTMTKINIDSDSTAEHVFKYVYDKLGNITEKRVKLDEGNPVTEKTINHQYDLLGRETEMTYPSGNTIIRRYDPAGRLKEVVGIE